MPNTTFGAAAARMGQPIADGYAQLATAFLRMAYACQTACVGFTEMEAQNAETLKRYREGEL